MHEHWQFLTSVEYMSVDLFAMCYGHQHELRDLKIHIIIISIRINKTTASLFSYAKSK